MKMPNDMLVFVRRPKNHPKGPKTIACFPYGQPVPPGVLIGKGSIITVESARDHLKMYKAD
jgi:hypothetical protein